MGDCASRASGAGAPGPAQRARGLALGAAAGDAGVGDRPSASCVLLQGGGEQGTCAVWAVTSTSDCDPVRSWPFRAQNTGMEIEFSSGA